MRKRIVMLLTAILLLGLIGGAQPVAACGPATTAGCDTPTAPPPAPASSTLP
jgi:hypothetical protein